MHFSDRGYFFSIMKNLELGPGGGVGGPKGKKECRCLIPYFEGLCWTINKHLPKNVSLP